MEDLVLDSENKGNVADEHIPFDQIKSLTQIATCLELLSRRYYA